MSYRELFSSINCQRIIFFEDDFKQTAFKKERALYDITRMDIADRDLFLSEIHATTSELKTQMRAYLTAIDEVFDVIEDWRNSVLFGDITTAFPLIGKRFPAQHEKIVNLYNEISTEAVAAIYSVGEKYGIGVSRPAQYDSIFDDYIFLGDRAKSFRVYTDFSSVTSALFSADLAESVSTQTIVCIIDNQLGDVKRADEIIRSIESEKELGRRNIIGCVFSSQERFETINKDVYFEYVSKADINNLEACLAKSAFNYYLSELKGETLNRIADAFETAQKSKGIAYFLSRKAMTEGESEYQIINDWIHLLSTASQTSSNSKKHLIALSRVINSLEDIAVVPDPSLQKLNTLEAFDYTVNDYYLPVAAGDVFTDDKDNWYILVGQDCDMARSKTRCPKNAIAELLPTTIRKQTEFRKWATDLEKASIYSFRKDLSSNSEILQVNYTKREFIANEILDLCSFNPDGVCRLSLTNSLSEEQRKLMPQYMVDYHCTLQEYFASVAEIKSKVGNAFSVVNNSEHAPRVISICDFDEASDLVVFGFRRVCRLTHTYVFYLYKLYLEYRGRQPFQSINLVRTEEVSLPVVAANKAKTEFFCKVQRIQDPNVSNPKDWCWIISAAELTRISELLKLGKPECTQEDLIISKPTIEFSLPSSKKLIVEKGRDKISFLAK